MQPLHALPTTSPQLSDNIGNNLVAFPTIQRDAGSWGVCFDHISEIVFPLKVVSILSVALSRRIHDVFDPQNHH